METYVHITKIIYKNLVKKNFWVYGAFVKITQQMIRLLPTYTFIRNTLAEEIGVSYK